MSQNQAEKPDQPNVKVEGEQAGVPAVPEGGGKALDAQAWQKEIEQQKERAEHSLDQWKRAEADLQNYRKRSEKERMELAKFGAASVMHSLLPVLDDLERALQTCPDPCYRLTWTEGVALIERKLRILLEQHGLKEIDALGKPFDPATHEALLEEETAAYPEGHVTAVLQKGYKLHDRVLRPAVVKVAKQQAAPAASAEAKPSADAANADESHAM
jgi:molecular chaperone GrpE